jgi:hypothetical protein
MMSGVPVLRVLTKAGRRYAGRLLALAFLLCTIGPPVALALADAAVATHCLTKGNHSAQPAVHVHSDGAAHRHDKAVAAQEHKHAQHEIDGKTTAGQCCGLFCMNATAELGIHAIPGAPPRESTLATAPDTAPGGLGPFRIDRPPNTLASI